jgi:fatty acid synthase subunit beta
VVQLVADETQELLEVVNHNVRSQQYVCAGHFRSLHVMTQTLNRFATLPPQPSLEASKTLLKPIIHLEALEAQALTTSDALQRGKATIPLRGIEVPFHSRCMHLPNSLSPISRLRTDHDAVLRHQIDHYRDNLLRSIKIEDINPADYVNRWIPNVTGTTFSTSKSYVEEVQRVTGSQQLLPLLEAMA